VKTAMQHMRVYGEGRIVRLEDRIEEDRRRFEAWHQRSLQQIDKDRTHYLAAHSGRLPRNLHQRLHSRKRNIAKRRAQRDRWLTDSFRIGGTPYLKLAAVFVGE